ncbi:unnamed protein product [Vitrella brassicaformis CCMP3155]|uniref:Uncharacterized protein n=1 Tax=Vitrella brassicaformis (strain CCMP3155) TaxID=1169540 RepID=A0A0G4FMB6_VITBC|nr:unnamed protein product [Vitrella brassicaformis CCMP3155]|eukprot:CEM15165.1 unnamed protein product [Vitrella brassicaformis CCMP3155]
MGSYIERETTSKGLPWPSILPTDDLMGVELLHDEGANERARIIGFNDHSSVPASVRDNPMYQAAVDVPQLKTICVSFGYPRDYFTPHILTLDDGKEIASVWMENRRTYRVRFEPKSVSPPQPPPQPTTTAPHRHSPHRHSPTAAAAGLWAQ